MGLRKRLKSRLTMKKQGTAFVDKVTGCTVSEWKDCYGDEWLAVTRIGMRVRT